MHGDESPSPWVTRFAHLVRPGAAVLDVACGAGRHTAFFAARGCSVDAVDRDPSLADAFAGLARVRFLAADIESGAWPYAGRHFDAVVVTNYLHRALWPYLRDAVADKGVVLYETFARGNEAFGKPSNPAFLLQARELLDVFSQGFFVVAYEDGELTAPRRARVQRVCAVRGGDASFALFDDVAGHARR
jgi:SAM-dependent methyltransferase